VLRVSTTQTVVRLPWRTAGYGRIVAPIGSDFASTRRES
jgi:hypothetical protein